jgi:hypothetical protein
MYSTINAPTRSLLSRAVTRKDRESDQREHPPLSTKEIFVLSFVVLIVAAGILVQTAVHERLPEASPVAFALEQAQRATLLRPSPPNVQLTSPVLPNAQPAGGRSKALAK